jgi:putative sugar O-methyltransferase
MSLKNFYLKIYPLRFGNYWKKVKNNGRFDDDIKSITNTFINSPSYSHVSNFWHILNIKNYQQLSEKGLESYGSTVATNYFTFIDFEEEYMDNILKNISPINFEADVFKKQNNFNHKQSFVYNYLCLLLYLNLKKNILYFNKLKKLNDQTYLGFDDPFITLEGINISIDKIVSLLDLEKIDKFIRLSSVNNILEIGAGSGRLSECIITNYPSIKYVICDIPPAIYIAYKRTKLGFPKKKVSLLIQNNEKEYLNNEIKNNDISFIFPHQLNLINKKLFDLVIAVDCLHEMNRKTLDSYFQLVSNLTNYFYFSIWNKTKNYYSRTIFKKTERLDFEKGDYPIPKAWKNIFKENLLFPSNQLGLGYLTK